jgi:ABC-type uncharacterized transport system auxiliary subunit
MNCRPRQLIISLAVFGTIVACGTIPLKHYYEMNYLPSTHWTRLSPTPYPCTIRVADFGIEQAYNRPEIVYRQSPFQLQYYYYRVWAVKPDRMATDLIYHHVLMSGLVANVIRRYDQSPKPDYDLDGNIEAVEEYDSGELWFAHLALTINLTKISDGTSIYTRRFDLRKRVYQHTPEYVIRELSSLMEYIMTQVIHDLDGKFAAAYNVSALPADTASPAPGNGIAPSPREVK